MTAATGDQSAKDFLPWLPVIGFALVIWVRAWGTRKTRSWRTVQKRAVAIAAVSFVLWVMSLQHAIVIVGILKPWIASCLLFLWVFLLPYLYTGESAQPTDSNAHKTSATPGTCRWISITRNQLRQNWRRHSSAALLPLILLDRLEELDPDNQSLRSLMDVPVRNLERVLGLQTPSLLNRFVKGLSLEIPRRGISAQSAGAPTPHMAVGYAMRENGEFRLEIRLQNPSVQSLLLARHLVEEHVGEPAPVGILQKLVTHQGAHPAALNNQPLTIGSSVGHQTGRPGSLGLFVNGAAGPGFLSCSHVVAKGGKASIGDTVYHPAPSDDALSKAPVGTLRAFEDLTSAGSHPMDAAFTVLTAGQGAGGNVVPAGHGWPSEGRALGPAASSPLAPRPKVAKIGRSSGWTGGQVVAEDLGPVEIYVPAVGGNVWIDGLIEIAWNGPDDPFSRGGDSGGLVYLADTLQPLGLLVGGGQLRLEDKVVGRSYACPLAPALKAWNLTLS